MELHTKEKLWACPRCKTNDIIDGSSGCSRGDCEVKIIGEIIIAYTLLPGESLDKYQENE